MNKRRTKRNCFNVFTVKSCWHQMSWYWSGSFVIRELLKCTDEDRNSCALSLLIIRKNQKIARVVIKRRTHELGSVKWRGLPTEVKTKNQVVSLCSIRTNLERHLERSISKNRNPWNQRKTSNRHHSTIDVKQICSRSRPNRKFTAFWEQLLASRASSHVGLIDAQVKRRT